MTSKAVIDRAIAANPSIKPNRIRAALKPRKHEEADEQAKVIEWRNWASKHQSDLYPMLRLLNCSMSALKRTPAQAARAKQQGMIAGVPDLHLPVPRGSYHSLYIEMKSSTGDTSASQKRFIRDLQDLGHCVHVCNSAKEAIAVIQDYYGVKNGRNE